MKKTLSQFSDAINWQVVGSVFLTFNRYLFPHLYILANLLLGIELFTYRGFTFNYLFLDTRFIMVVALISFAIIFGERLRSTQSKIPGITRLTLELNKLSILPLLLINYLLISLDLQYYPNYVYSQFHINASNLQLIVSFNILILILQTIQKSKPISVFIWQRLQFKYAINLLFLILVANAVFPQFQVVSRWMFDGTIKIIRTADLSWEERLVFLNGGKNSTGWITYYTNFINRHVDERGVIFIPPQKESWQMEGNPYYMRWFLYPRFTVQSQDIEAPIPQEAEYVLIDFGIWPGMTEYGWPRMHIPADRIEKMVLLDRETGEETVVTNQDYNPDNLSYKWGIIKLRK